MLRYIISQSRYCRNMTKNKKSVKKHSRTFLLLFYSGKIFGINTFSLSESNQLRRSYLSVIYVIFLMTVYVHSTCSFVIDRKKALLPGETPLSLIMDFMGIAIGFFEVLLGLTIFLISRDRIESILKSFHKIDQIQMQLKIDNDYEKHFYRLAISLMMFDCFCFVRNNSNAKMFQSNDVHFIIWMWYGLFGFIPSNIVILFVWIVNIVQEKFHRLNENIKTCAINDHVALCADPTNGASLRLGEDSSDDFYEKINMISRLHRELRKAIRLVEQHFALLVLLYSVKNLLSLTSTVHIAYRYLKDCENFTWADFGYILHVSAWWATPVLGICVISNICGSTSNEANETANVLHAILNKCQICGNDEEIPELDILFLDLLQNKVTISLLGFVEANYFLMYSIIVTAASYLAIMLQFYD